MLVVAVLYWAQDVLVPFALAILLTFVLTPPVTWLQRWVGRVAAVLLAVTLVFTTVGLAGWGLTRQMPPSPSSKTRYLVKRLRSSLPDVRIAVGRWAPPARADDNSQALVEAGANHVASLLAESLGYFAGLTEMRVDDAPGGQAPADLAPAG